eukprot:15440201-Alexandrium_andersonii.AAC.1
MLVGIPARRFKFELVRGEFQFYLGVRARGGVRLKFVELYVGVGWRSVDLRASPARVDRRLTLQTACSSLQ